MTTEGDPSTRIVLSWLREDAHENAERVLLRALDEVDTTPQRRSSWPARRTDRMTTYAKLIAAAAAVLAVAIVGYQFLPGGSGSGGTNATPPPLRPRLLARGVFVAAWGAVELRAIAEGSSVTGRLFVREEGSENFDVDLQCTRTTEDGLIMIGGYTETGPAGRAADRATAIVLKRGSPVMATIWRGGPRSQAASCLAFLDEQLREQGGTVDLEPIEGFVELGTNATPAPSSALLARGSFVTVRGAVELEATGEGSSVRGRMTVAPEEGPAFTVDLQCARTTEDGLIMIGGYTAGGGSGLSPEGTLAAIVLERGSPVQATVWYQRGGPTSRAASCLAYLDEQLNEKLMDPRVNDDDPSPIVGTVELRP